MANPFASSLIGIIVYEERLTDPGWHELLAAAALIAAFGGAVIVTLGNREKEMPGGVASA
jgi:hypothetical protein